MNGRVLTEEELNWIEDTVSTKEHIADLIATIRDRDKTIRILSETVHGFKTGYYRESEQNTILREALEQVQWYKDGTGWMRCPVCGWTQDAGHGTDCAIGEALAKVSADRGVL